MKNLRIKAVVGFLLLGISSTGAEDITNIIARMQERVVTVIVLDGTHQELCRGTGFYVRDSINNGIVRNAIITNYHVLCCCDISYFERVPLDDIYVTGINSQGKQLQAVHVSSKDKNMTFQDNSVLVDMPNDLALIRLTKDETEGYSPWFIGMVHETRGGEIRGGLLDPNFDAKDSINAGLAREELDSRYNLSNVNHLAQGQRIYIIGTPLGQYPGTVSDGIISAFRGNRIQITAAISHGSSGSPVINELGQLVGVAEASQEAGQSLNFAIDNIAVENLLADYEHMLYWTGLVRFPGQSLFPTPKGH
jgi:Trypsin-like peptidase domain